MTPAVPHRDAAFLSGDGVPDAPAPEAPGVPPVPMEDPARPSPPLVDPEPPREPDEPPLRIDEPEEPDGPAPHHEPAMREAVRELFPTPPLALGTRLANGRYTVRGVAGVGACGTVYEAERADGARFAVKVPHEEHVRSPAGAARFLGEITLASSVRHPNLAEVHERGQLPDGRPFMVMELVRGQSVAERLARGVVPIAEALDLCNGVLRALEALAEHAIVHRDVKPANVLVSHDVGAPRVVLVDFGTATLRERAPEPGTARRGTSLIGTPDYMAPEQFDGRPVDARTDVYGAAALLFELLTGRAPLCELGPDGWRGERAPLRTLRRDANAALEAVVARALAPEPADRYRDARAFRLALQRARRTRMQVLRPLLAAPALAAAAYLIAPWVVETRGVAAQERVASAAAPATPAPHASSASRCDAPSMLVVAESEPSPEALGAASAEPLGAARVPCAAVP